MTLLYLSLSVESPLDRCRVRSYRPFDVPGRNLFHESKNFAKAAAATPAADGPPVIFISHRKADAEQAREVAETLLAANADIYFDENDTCLAGASEESDPKTVVKCIDAGLRSSTHFLGLITVRTQGSWWVPYEIGASRMRLADPARCAFIVAPEVTVLPAYISVAHLLKDRAELKAWLPSWLAKNASTDRMITEALAKVLSLAVGPKFLPAARSEPLTFRPST